MLSKTIQSLYCASSIPITNLHRIQHIKSPIITKLQGQSQIPSIIHNYIHNRRHFSVEIVQTLEPEIKLDADGNKIEPTGPKFVPGVGFVDEEGNRLGVSPEDDDIMIHGSSYGDSSSTSLSVDCWSLYPKEHNATLIWLPGVGETYNTAKNLFEMLQTQGIRFVVPNPPKNVVTALGDKVERAWYDIISETYSADMEEDFEGLENSSRLLHELIDEEALLLGSRYTPEGTSLDKMLQLGARRIFVGGFAQGGALALHSVVRYPRRVAGIVSFSGYFPFAQETLETAKATEDALKSIVKDEIDNEKVDEVVKDDNSTPTSITPKQAINLKCPVLAIHGRSDEAIPLSFASDTYKIIQNEPMNMRVQLRSVYNMKHFMADHECFGMHSWIMAFVNKFPKWKVYREHF